MMRKLSGFCKRRYENVSVDTWLKDWYKLKYGLRPNS